MRSKVMLAKVMLAVFASVFLFSVNGSPEDAKGPIIYLKFDEEQGDIAEDSSGFGNNGQIIGGTSGAVCRVEGKSGKALEFNVEKGDGYVKVKNAGKYDLSKGVTFQAWVKYTAPKTKKNPNFYLIANTVGAYGPGFVLKFSGGIKYRIYFCSGEGKGETALLLFTPRLYDEGEWHHVAATYDGKYQGRIYVDGKVVSTEWSTHVNPKGMDHFFISIGGAYMFNGIVDEVKIYDYARKSGDILKEARLEEWKK